MVKRVNKINLSERLKGLNKVVNAGFLPNKTYPDDTPVALIAIVQDQGSVSKGIPPRSFMKPAMEFNKNRLSNLVRFEVVRILNGNSNAENLYEQVGALMVGAIKREISLVNSPPLNSATIAARDRRHCAGADSEKPLIDTGHMLNSVDFEVVNET